MDSFALAFTVCEILILNTFRIENLGQVHRREKRKNIRTAVRMYTAKFFIILAVRQHTKTNFTYTHKNTARVRDDDYKKNLPNGFA